eukprot:SAG11_NODE_22308_length_408_cov_1.006472_1_plen_76_part_01
MIHKLTADFLRAKLAVGNIGAEPERENSANCANGTSGGSCVNSAPRLKRVEAFVAAHPCTVVFGRLEALPAVTDRV